MNFLQGLPLLLLIFATSIAAQQQFKLPGLRVLRNTIFRHPGASKASVSEDFQTFFFDQTLDHFNYRPDSYATFKQRYVINSKYWGGAKDAAPIFAYLGAEAAIDGDLTGVGFTTENALKFNALIVYIEHRFYGQSIPFGLTLEEALHNATTRGYFSSAQAIADYAAVLAYLKNKFDAEDSPVIVVGGSYGGMLASWFRLKYPHITLGALASSAPILYFDDITPQNGYYSIITKDYKKASISCYETIQKSWAEIDRIASQPSGLSTLSKIFKTCSKLNTTGELKDYLETIYVQTAQYNDPPKYPVTEVCGGIDGAAEGADTLSRIFAGVAANRGSSSCYDTNEFSGLTQTSLGWSWQRCSEIVMPIGRGENDTMFPAAPFNLSSFSEDCKSIYGVPPRPHWITTYYGGHDIKLILRRFGSNIIFSNGLRDPYSSAGVLENISDSVVALSTVNGSHCLDIRPSREDDPKWLVEQRKAEVGIIEGWISKYKVDLAASKRQ